MKNYGIKEVFKIKERANSENDMLKTLYDSMPGQLFALEEHYPYRVLFINKEALSFFCIKNDTNINNLTLKDLVSPEEYDYILNDIKKIKNGKKIINWNRNFSDIRNNIVHFLGRTSLIEKPDGTSFIQIYYYNMNTINHLQNSINQIEYHVKNIADNVSDGLCFYEVKNGELFPLYVNEGYLNIIGYNRNNYDTNSSINDKVHPEDLIALSSAINECLASGKVMEFKLRVIDFSNDYHWINAKAHRIDDYPGTNNPVIFAFVTDVTEKRRAETALRKSEEAKRKTFEELRKKNQQIELILSSISGGLASYECDTYDFLYVSDELCKMLGYSKEELLSITKGNVLNLIYYIDKVKAVKDYHTSFLENEKNYAVKYRVVCKDGSLKWILDSGYKCKSHDGKDIINCLFLDIDELQQSTLKVTEQKDFLDSIYNSVMCGILRYHNVGGEFAFIMMNNEALKILGYETEEECLKLGREEFLSRIYYEDRDYILSKINVLKYVGENFSEEYRIKRPDGEIRWVYATSEMVKDAKGNILNQRVMMDITDRKKLEMEERLSGIIRTAYDVVVDIDLNTGEYIENDFSEMSYFKKNYGNYKRSFLHMLRHDIDHRDTKYVANTLGIKNLRCIAEDKPDVRKISCKYRLKEDEHKWIEATAIFNSGKNRNRINLIIRDITDQVKQEELIEAQNRALEKALKKANAANEAKSLFLSSMSHDIRTPMNGIVGMTTVAKESIKNEDRIKDCLDKIDVSSKHLLSLINDILDMSRIESGNLILKEENVNISDLFHDTLTIILSQAKEKKQHIRLDIDVEHENIIVDSLRLQQVFINILSNAIKFTDYNGNININIYELPQTRDGYANYKFEFIDDGIGMSKEFVDNIFEPFERENKEMSGKIQGTGLGMTITKRILDMMGGKISVKSELGKGTCFTVYASYKLNHIKETRINDSVKDLRVLIADSSQKNAKRLNLILNSLGIKNDFTTLGAKALEMTVKAYEHSMQYDVILIDLDMKDMDGIEVCKNIRKALKNKYDPTLVLSDVLDSEDYINADKAGFDIVANRPIFKSDIIKLFNGLIDEDIKREVHKNNKSSLSGKRILIAEDNELNKEIAVELIKGITGNIDTVENGKEVLDKLAVHEDGYYDLILMDIQMPILNGYEATKQIRKAKNEYYKNIPIVAMTANAFDSDVKKALDSGMNEHLSKPIDVKKVNEVLKTYLGN